MNSEGFGFPLIRVPALSRRLEALAVGSWGNSHYLGELLRKNAVVIEADLCDLQLWVEQELARFQDP